MCRAPVFGTIAAMIYIIYGKDYAENAYDVLQASDIAEYLDADHSVAIKPNLVVPSPAVVGATTHPEVVEGIILYLKSFGVKRIKIIESSWVGDSTIRAFKNCGYEELSKKHGVPLVDLKSDGSSVAKPGGRELRVCDEALGTDFLINAPVLKAHCQTRMTCCMKNLKGCIPDSEKRRYHTLGIHKPVAELNAIIKTGYCVVDGICGDLSFEEGGNPVVADRIIAGRNPLLVDSYCAELIGYSPDEIEYLAHGKALGIGSYFSRETPVVELNSRDKPAHDTNTGFAAAEKYRALIEEDAACSACYSSLIFALHRLGGRTSAKGKIRIGQGFKGKTVAGVGVGNCARGCEICVAGCPPKATDIISHLTER